jgi:hypothetical protein
MLDKKTWEEFRASGLFWWINTLLHTFGWALVVEIENGEIKTVYPSRVKFRGFSEEINSDGYKKISEYMVANAEELKKEAEECFYFERR